MAVFCVDDKMTERNIEKRMRANGRMSAHLDEKRMEGNVNEPQMDLHGISGFEGRRHQLLMD